jgi:hydrogenase maturation protease
VATVIGLGSPHGDDRAGWDVIDRLQMHWIGRPDLRLVHLSKSPVDLLWHLSPDIPTWIVDAAIGAAIEGPYARLVWPAAPIQGVRNCTSHAVDLAQLLALGQALALCPPQIVIYAIPIENSQPAHVPSAEVAQRVRVAAQALHRELVELIGIPRSAPESPDA